MEVFNEYAALYDLFYRDKDYRAECGYVMGLIEKHSGRPVRSILDIGCGTGGHAIVWAGQGIEVCCLELSEEMLKQAREKAEGLKLDIAFVAADLRGFDLERTFDAVTAMFAVMSYQTRTEDILAALNSARRHLEPGGVFIFDVWSGTGVISDPPGDRVGHFEMDGMEIIRTARADHNQDLHLVKVHYDIVCIKGDRVIKRVREVHEMHYLFPDEVAGYAARTGFEMAACEPFMKHGASLGLDDWNATFVLKAV
jgi:SAM-dependent methyltransferase